jgi:hypothetical protein
MNDLTKTIGGGKEKYELGRQTKENENREIMGGNEERRINKKHDIFLTTLEVEIPQTNAMCAYETLNDVHTRLNTVKCLTVRAGVNMRGILVQRRYPALPKSFCSKQRQDLKL